MFVAEPTSDKMNILFTIGTFDNFGGTEKITMVLAEEFAKNYHVCIAAFNGICRPEKLGLSSNVKCYSLAQMGKHVDHTLREVLINEKIDLIFNQWCLPYFVTRTINKARKGLPIRLISVLHGVPDRSKRVIVAEDAVKAAHGIKRIIASAKLFAIDKVIRASIRYVYRNSDAYVVLSKGFLKSFRDYTGMKGELSKLHAIGNPITQPTDCATNWIPGKKREILYVGRMDKENKRVNRIIEAWEQIAGGAPDWCLRLVGGGPHIDELKAYVADHAIPRVTFHGFVEDTLPYYKTASIFMLTSDLEGFGLVLLDAMSYGVVPIVYGSYVSVYDIIDNGKNGLITPAQYSQDATIAALQELMSDTIKREQMAYAAIEKSKQFTLAEIMKMWNALVSVLNIK